MEIKMQTDDLVTVAQAADQLSRPRMAIYRMVKRNRMIGVTFGGVLYIPTSELERMKKELETEPAEVLASPGDSIKSELQE